MRLKSALLALAIVLIPYLASAEEAGYKSTAESRASVEVTVYNNNLGLVKDVRRIELPAGRASLQFMDVAAHVIPETVRARSTNAPDAFTVLEQNYEYDLMNADKLLDKYIGKKIKLINRNPSTDKIDAVEATLLSNNQGQIFRINGEIYLGYPGIRVLPELPENLIAKPTLMWLYENESTRPHEVEVSYLTNNINWKADYVLVLDKDDAKADLSGWVTLDNRSGAAYKDAKLKLVAGEVQRVTYAVRDALYEMDGRMEKKAEAPAFSGKAFFEYHIYDLNVKTTIKENQTKQISLLETSGVNTGKEFLVYGIQSYFTRLYRVENPKQAVNVFIKFKNSKDNHLGMALPAGIMRLYKKDDTGSLQFIGEDNIAHTPKDEDVRLKVGTAFDITAERVQTDYKLLPSKDGKSVHETEWEITLRNHKESDVAVGIIEPLYGSWSVLRSSHRFTKADAFTLRFNVNVPKDKEVKVRYRVRVEI